MLQKELLKILLEISKRKIILRIQKLDLLLFQLENILIEYTKHIDKHTHNLTLRLQHLYVLIID